MVNYLLEHASEFPGVSTGRAYLRHYPYQDLAAQVLGYVGSITQAQLKHLGRGYDLNDEIGQTGVESAFDKYLRGVAGASEAARRQPQSPARQRAADRSAEAREHRAADARREASAGRREGARLRHQPRAGERRVGGARRRDRRARSARRLDPRDGVVADVQAVGLLRPRDDEGAREPGADAEDRAREELPVAEPRDAGDVSAGLRVQAGDCARRDARAPRLAVRVPAVHGDVPVAERQVAPGVPQLGPERQPADGHADRARVLVRHVLLPTRRQVLVAAEGSRPAAAAVGAHVRLRQARPAPTSGRRCPGSCRRSAGRSSTSRPRSIASGSRATRSTSRSARATCS